MRFSIYDLAGRRGAAPHRLSFGDSAARLVRGLFTFARIAQRIVNRKSEIGIEWCGCRKLHPDILRGGETFWLLNHSRKESKKGREQSLSRPMPFQQRTNTSCYLAIPTRGFTAALSVFWGTPPAKPLDCKIRLNSVGALSFDPWADPTGGEPRLSHAFFCFVPGDIIKTSFAFYSQCYAFR